MKSYSQAHQDLFVLHVLDFITGGIYLEIGCSDPIEINNTYLLEKEYNWTGISIDIDEKHKTRWNQIRKNPIIIADALELEYSTLFKVRVIDYLSLDIDAEYVNVLKKIPFDKYVFKVITIEHDAYRFGDLYRVPEREFLHGHGYILVASNVKSNGCVYEDWWVHPQYVKLHQYINYVCDNKEYSDII
jgi:hypothetical protein